MLPNQRQTLPSKSLTAESKTNANRLPARPMPYSSGVSASFGSGPSIGFRGNVPSRMAAL